MPVRLVVLTLALQGQLKVGLDIEQACQGVVTHTRSMRHMRQPAIPPLLHSISAPVALCEPKCILNSQIHTDWLPCSRLDSFHTGCSCLALVCGWGERTQRSFWDSNSRAKTQPHLKLITEEQVLKNQEKRGTKQNQSREGPWGEAVKVNHVVKAASAQGALIVAIHIK